MRPDFWRYAKKQIRNVFTDLKQRAQKVDIQALAADWAVTGVDLSYWQGAVDFDRLVLSADFAYLRAGYGNDFFDPRMVEYVAGCADHALPWGLYWYLRPGKDWRKQATNFYDIWQSSGGQLYPVFDLEESGGLSKMALESWLKKCYDLFCNLSGREYNQVMTYTSPGFLNAAMPLTNWLKHTQLWVAHWGTGSQPIIPNEWAIPGFTWKFRQWSATGKGSDYGVSSRYVDLDCYNGTREQFAAEFGVTPPHPPQEHEMKYKVNIDGLKIRKEPVVVEGNEVGMRVKGEIVIPLDTIGDSLRSKSYWVKDARGWSAAQWLGVEYMEPFV